MKYLIVKQVHEEVELDPQTLLTITQAAKILGVTVEAINAAINRGTYTRIINPSAPKRQGRQLLLKSEVEQIKK